MNSSEVLVLRGWVPRSHVEGKSDSNGLRPTGQVDVVGVVRGGEAVRS